MICFWPGHHGNDYTVLGTMEKPAWKQGVQKPLDFQDMAVLVIAHPLRHRLDG